MLDIGNTHVHGGVFENGSNEPKETFRLKQYDMTADSFGIKNTSLSTMSRSRSFSTNEVGICSVVPSLRAAASRECT